MSAVATGMDVAPNAIARGRGDTPGRIVAWCLVTALDYAFFGPNGALYGIAGGPPDPLRSVLVVSPPGVDPVRAGRVLFPPVRALAAPRLGAPPVRPRGRWQRAL